MDALTSIELQDLGEVDPTSPTGRQWDALAASNSASGFMQSTSWAQFKRQMGMDVRHFGLFADEQLFGGAIFYAAPNSKGAGFLVAPDGPVLPWDDLVRAETGLQLLLDATDADAQSMGIMALRIAPRLHLPKPDVLRGFAMAPVSLTESKTMYLDLSSDAQDWLTSIKPKARYNIGLAERKGVTIREDSSITAAKDFYAVMQTVAKRDKFFLEPRSVFIALIETLCPTGLAKVFFAEHEGEILGALLMVTFGDRSTYLYGGTTDAKRNLMGGYALQFAAINAAKKSGAKTYDFWGYDPTAPAGDSYAGFSRFKSQFCGEAVELIGTLDFYFIDHLADVVIRAINEIQPRTVSSDHTKELKMLESE